MDVLDQGFASAIVGWFDSADQTLPAHDPGEDAPCPVCFRRLGSRKTAKSVSLMPATRRVRSYFYYMHGPCAADDVARSRIDELVMDFIEKSDAH